MMTLLEQFLWERRRQQGLGKWRAPGLRPEAQMSDRGRRKGLFPRSRHLNVAAAILELIRSKSNKLNQLRRRQQKLSKKATPTRRIKRLRLIINRSSSSQTMMEPRSPLITIQGGLLQIETRSGAMRHTGGCRRTLGTLSMWPS